MLTYFPPGTPPDLYALTYGAEVNDNGHGFAIVTPDQIIVRQGLDSDEMILAFDALRDAYPDGPALFHSRFATHGACDVDNCHPFQVDHDARTVLAHNGILPRRVRPKSGDPRSDTRIAADGFLSRKGYSDWDDPRAQRALVQWLGPHNKFVVLTIDPRYREHAYLINEEAGIWDCGIWYSNGDYRAESHIGPGISLGVGDAALYSECPECLIPGVIDGNGFCLICGACADCGEPDGYCVCYVPGRFPLPNGSELDWSAYAEEATR
jgi:glutamine amidotransferase